MRRLPAALTFALAIAVIAAPATAEAKKRHSHKPSGVEGVVLDSTCAGACQVPPPPEPAYTGPVTITAIRVSDGQQVASQAISDGHFRLKRGLYNVSSVPPAPPTCEPTPQTVCPLDQAQSAAIVRPCTQGETKQVQVRRHKFAHVELHMSNVCVV